MEMICEALAATAILGAAVVAGLIRYLMSSIGHSKMYRKAGQAPWKAFIPVLNTYTNYQIAWSSKFFFLYAALFILVNALSSNGALQLLVAAAGIVMIVVDIKQHVKMAKCFGKGAGTGILLILFPGITSLVLGLGNAEFMAIEN